MFQVHRARYFSRADKVICTVPRAASTSVSYALDQRFTDFKRHSDLSEIDLTGKDVLLWLRNPYDRLESAHKLFHSLTPAEFGAKVLAEDNAHWRPQLEMHPEATIVMRFDDLKATWKQHFPDVRLQPMRWQPSPEKVSWIDMVQAMPDGMQEAIDLKYAADYAAWSAL